MELRLRLIVLVLLAFPFVGNAHAILLTSNPAVRQSIKGPDLEIHLTFNSRIDAKRSQLTLIGPDRTQAPVTIVGQPSPQTVNGKANGLKAGQYILRWQVLANDGHITRGEIPFSVE